MSSEPIIQVNDAGKVYRLYRNPMDRLWQFLWPSRSGSFKDFTAVQDVSFELHRGEVLGIVGINGAGKSTVLQLVTGTIKPTSGSVHTRGRVAAILELGSGFNPEFSGRENIFLNAATLGLSKAEISSRIHSIIDFAGIGLHIDQPVKTYSSGMLVRLAFSIATSVDPDILIIDEALSVGDGAFRRQSFDRIMEIKQRGASILFCSHVLFHVEAFCDRALWLHRGKVQKLGNVSEVLGPYQEFLDDYSNDVNAQPGRHIAAQRAPDETKTDSSSAGVAPRGDARIDAVQVYLDGLEGSELVGTSLVSRLEVVIRFASDPQLPTPTAAVVLSSDSGKILGSFSSKTQGIEFDRDASGAGTARVCIDKIPLNKGRYRVGAYLFCERGVHGYGMLDPAAHIHLDHQGTEAGAIVLHGTWDNGHGDAQYKGNLLSRQLPPRELGQLFESMQLSAAGADPRVGEYAMECNNPQTLCFLIDAYPTLQSIFDEYPRMGTIRFLDIGPAFGAAGGLLSQMHSSHFLGPKLEVDALDIVNTRQHFIEMTYPRVNFIHASVEALPREAIWDVVYCSNAIEHTDNPKALIAKILQHTRGHAVFLAPYREELPLSLDHRLQITEQTFSDFRVRNTKIFKSAAWPTTADGVERQQILVVIDGECPEDAR